MVHLGVERQVSRGVELLNSTTVTGPGTKGSVLISQERYHYIPRPNYSDNINTYYTFFGNQAKMPKESQQTANFNTIKIVNERERRVAALYIHRWV